MSVIRLRQILICSMDITLLLLTEWRILTEVNMLISEEAGRIFMVRGLVTY